jgi:hypothetical protein
MKDYIEIFDETHGESFRQHRKQQTKKDLIFQIILFIVCLILCFAIMIVSNLLMINNYDERNILNDIQLILTKETLWIIFLVISVVITRMVHKARKLTTKTDFYSHKTKEFATTVYLDGFMTALQTAFIVESDFKENLKMAMKELYWYDSEYDTFNPGFSLDDECYFGQRMVSKANGEAYYLVNWEDKETGFFIECLKVEGKMDCAEFFLPV